MFLKDLLNCSFQELVQQIRVYFTNNDFKLLQLRLRYSFGVYPTCCLNDLLKCWGYLNPSS